MKKFFALFLILNFLLFYNLTATATPYSTMKEGFYKVSNLHLELSNSYTIENISFNNRVMVFIIDENQIIQQSLRLIPQSGKYNLIPIEPSYRIVILGDGEVAIT